MKKFYLLAILFFTLLVSINAQDMIVLTNGNIIEAKVEEISPTEIKYRRFDNLNGPLIVINKSDVFSIRYENGIVEVITEPSSTGQQAVPVIDPITIKSTALDPNKLYFSISLEPSGLLVGGPSATTEFSKGAFNALIHVSFPTLALLNNTSKGFGFGLGASFNYFWLGRIGGFYLGGLLEWNIAPYYETYYHPYSIYNPATDSFSGQYLDEKTTAHNFILALNAGYKFITKSGVYFRTGIAVGVALSTYLPFGFYYKPDIAMGYIF